MQLSEEAESSTTRLPLHTIILLVREGLQSLQDNLQDLAGADLIEEAATQIQALFMATIKLLFVPDPAFHVASSRIFIPKLLECSALLQSAHSVDTELLDAPLKDAVL